MLQHWLVWCCGTCDDDGASAVSVEAAEQPRVAMPEPLLRSPYSEAPQGAELVVEDCAGGEPVVEDAVASEEDDGRIEVLLEKTDPGQSLGFTVDCLTSRALLVNSVVQGGLLDAYNTQAPADKRCHPGTYIVGVNNKSDGVTSMIREMQSADKVTLRLAPRAEFSVDITKEVGSLLALNLHFLPGSNSLVVTEIGNGLIKEYNERAGDSDKVIKASDRIVEVNGHSGNAATLMEALRKNRELNLKLVHPPTP
mmetsp:Transcript_51676/g.166258  ORF Transcript_51676/g.166258 Transcript_51676/m.166258 type:complete len:253 (-) Transcript_51676:59-817(-)